MDYNNALSFCESFAANKSSMSLDNMKTLLSLLGNPHEMGKYIHVAGTNGKGSVVSYISEILKSAGLKVGKFISPHLSRINERFSINGKEMDDDEFAACVAEIHDALSKYNELKNSLTMFEIMTCIAFLYFKRNKCDISVLETGLGGRLDATNVIQNPLLSVITMIGFDHTKILGETIEEIAFEKACIMKQNGLSIIAPQKHESAYQVFEDYAKANNIETVLVDKNSISINNSNLNTQIFNYKGLMDLKITLLGDHQTENAATAVETALALAKKGYIIPEEAIYKGLDMATWPCRLEVVKSDPLTIIDGAHNVDGVKVLSEFIRKSFNDKKIFYIFGVMKDKNYKAMIQEIKSTAKEVYLIKMNYDRAEGIETLKSVLADYGIGSKAFYNLEEAIDYSYKHVSQDDVVCIFGSLYLAGDAKKHILEKYNGQHMKK